MWKNSVSAVDAVFALDCKDSMVRSARHSGAKRHKNESARRGFCKKRETTVVKTPVLGLLV
jgi:hypothetical protein